MSKELLPVETMSEAIKQSFQEIDARAGKDRLAIVGVPSGWPDLDNLTAGLPLGALWAVCGRAGYGKTTFLTNVVRQVVTQEKKPALMLSTESSRIEMAEVFLSAQSRVSLHQIRRGHLNADAIQSLINAGDALRPAPLFLSSLARMPVQQLLETIHEYHTQSGVNIVAVDSLDTIEPENTRELRHEQIATIARTLKALARELNVFILVSVRLRYDTPDKATSLMELKQNWLIEHEADAVLLLNRPGKCNSYEQEDDIMEVTVGKQRNGPTGSITFAYTKECYRLDTYVSELSQ